VTLTKTDLSAIRTFGLLGVKLVSANKELSLLKFGSGDFIFSPCWNHRNFDIQRTMIIYVFFYTFTLS
jgi:hypothetical protein